MSNAPDQSSHASHETPAPPQERLATQFITWHASTGGLHLRTDACIVFIDKSKTDLIEQAKKLYRGQPITVTGESTFSTMLSTHVFAIDTMK